MSTNNPMGTGFFNFSQGNFITRVGYDDNSNAQYQAWAMPGTADSEGKWRIIKNAYDASNRFTGSGFAQDANGNASCGFAFIWDNRASYSYS